MLFKSKELHIFVLSLIKKNQTSLLLIYIMDIVFNFYEKKTDEVK